MKIKNGLSSSVKSDVELANKPPLYHCYYYTYISIFKHGGAVWINIKTPAKPTGEKQMVQRSSAKKQSGKEKKRKIAWYPERVSP